MIYCCEHGLSVCKEDYTQFELDEMKKAFFKERNENKTKNSLKLKGYT